MALDRLVHQSRPQQLADALLHIARTNHYMVGLVERVTAEEFDKAEQILIRLENGDGYASRRKKKIIQLAFDLLAHYRNQVNLRKGS